MAGHGDYHPAFGRALIAGSRGPDGPAVVDPRAARSSWRGSTTPSGPPPQPTGSNVWNTTLFVGWDEPGGTYDHVPPGPVPPPDPARRPGSSASPSTAPATGSRPHRVALGRAGPVCNRGVPAHLADRDAAQGVGPRRAVHPATRRRAPSRGCAAWRCPARPRRGPTSTRCRSPPSRRSTWTPCGRSAPWGGTCATACTSTRATTRTFPTLPMSTPPSHPCSPLTSRCASAAGCSHGWPGTDRSAEPPASGWCRAPLDQDPVTATGATSGMSASPDRPEVPAATAATR